MITWKVLSIPAGIAVGLLGSSRFANAAEPVSPPATEEARSTQREFQTNLERQRAAEATATAALERELAALEPVQQYARLIEEARRRADAGAFQSAVSLYNRAMVVKPADLDLAPEVRALKTKLLLQSKPVMVALRSDGATFVAIDGVRMLGAFTMVNVPLLPGDYEVIGRRAGYVEVRLPLRVRGDEPTPAVDVIASEPAA